MTALYQVKTLGEETVCIYLFWFVYWCCQLRLYSIKWLIIVLLKVLSWHFRGGTEENYETSKDAQSLGWDLNPEPGDDVMGDHRFLLIYIIFAPFCVVLDQWELWTKPSWNRSLRVTVPGASGQSDPINFV
jgi:hypothetical protein